MRVRVYLCFSYVLAFAFAFPILSANAADPITITIPCGTAPWSACADLKAQLTTGDLKSTTPGGFKAAVREMLDDVYLGKVRVAKNLVGPDECTAFDNLSKPPICSPLKIPENGCVSEAMKSYKVPDGMAADCPNISKVGAATDDNPLYSLGKSDLGTLESSNVAAGLVMAVSNQGADIQTQINQNALTISATSSCYAKATSLQRLITRQSDVQLVSQILTCDPSDMTTNCSAKEYFKANYKTILSGYLQLAKCRLSDESSGKFVAFTMDPGSPMKSYTTVLRDLYMQQCFYRNKGNPANMRNCYAQKYDAWIKQRARTSFPNVAAGCPL